jgi:hypothetical protein
MSAVDDSIAKIIADKNAALKESALWKAEAALWKAEAALWKAEAERWRQIALEQSHENRTDRETNNTETNPDCS